MEVKHLNSNYEADLISLSKDQIVNDLFHYSEKCLVFISLRGLIIKYNNAFGDLHLSKSTNLVKDNLLDFLGDTSKEVFKEMLRWIVKKDSEIHNKLIFVTSSEQKLETSVTLKAIHDGSSRYALAIIEANKVREVEDKFSKLFLAISDNLNEGIYRNSPEKGMIYVNKSFAKLFGYNSIKEVLRITPGQLYAENSERKRISKLLSENNRLVNESILFRKKDGTTFWGLVNCSVTREFNGNTFYDGAIVDITEQKDYEETLQQKNRELKKINAQMDRFLYSAYHDIRSPIASVLGLTNIMRMELQDEQMCSYLDRIDESLNKLDYFVNDVKNFSQNTRQHISSKKIEFATLINSVWKKFKSSQSLIELQINVDESKVFYSDPSRIELILENILKNSSQFVDKTKNEYYIKVNVQLTYDKAIIEILDNGIGIGKQHLDKVFNMFYRGTETSKGSGLGLYIAKETVLKLNGQICIESEVGLGTIINIEIPNDKKGRLISRKFMLQRH